MKVRSALCPIAILVSAAACGGNPATPSPVATLVEPATVVQPTTWAVNGRVLAGPDGAPVAGASLVFGAQPPATTGADGAYRFVTTDASLQSLVVSAPGFQTRETLLRGGAERSVDIDLIGGDLLTIYRQMARNAWVAPSNAGATPTKRWSENPNIYIWTTWRDTGAPVQNVDFYEQQIRRVIPQLSGGTLTAGTIESGPSERTPSAGWINVVFDHGGNNALVGANPGRVQFGGDNRCNYIAVTHEFGHAMGYWHNGFPGTIMGGLAGFCHDANFSPNELRVAKAMYARASGNVEPDRDPNASSPLRIAGTPAVAVYCDRVLR